MINDAPKIGTFAVFFTKTSSMCPRQFEWLPARLKRISFANISPKQFHQNLMVSCVISIPRSWRRSSTCRKFSGKRTYYNTASLMISGLVLKCLNGEHLLIFRNCADQRDIVKFLRQHSSQCPPRGAGALIDTFSGLIPRSERLISSLVSKKTIWDMANSKARRQPAANASLLDTPAREKYRERPGAPR